MFFGRTWIEAVVAMMMFPRGIRRTPMTLKFYYEWIEPIFKPIYLRPMHLRALQEGFCFSPREPVPRTQMVDVEILFRNYLAV